MRTVWPEGWRTGRKETAVRLNGWCEGGLGFSFKLSFLLGPEFFLTALSCSGGYHLESGGMPLHDAVGINCKNGTTTENQCSDVKYMG